MIRLLKRLVRNTRGATAIEFAVVAVPFFALILGTVQLALIYFSGEALDAGMSAAVRAVQTGQSQQMTSALATSKFRNEVCRYTTPLLRCDDIIFDVRVSSSFNSPMSAFITGGKIQPGALKFETGGSSAIVVARAMYLYPVFAPFLGAGLANMGNKHLLVATHAFRNEPFPSSGSSSP